MSLYNSCQTFNNKKEIFDMAKAKATKARPVLVTTSHRGVFFGYADKTDGATITLKKCRNVVYWTSDLRGFLGLAVTGPTAKSKVGPAAASSELRDITSITDCEPAAVAAFEAAPWAQ